MRPRLQLEQELAAAGNPARAAHSAGFFKCGPGQYGEGDIFLGIPVPTQRRIALKYVALPLAEIERLLRSNIHEHRFAALEILVAQYEAGDDAQRQTIFDCYLRNGPRANNWDLVDTSAPYIAGAHLLNRSRSPLRKLAKSANLWERRIAIVATFAFIRAGETAPTFQIAELLLSDKHDLIHKAVGWALREAGKKAKAGLVQFLREHYAQLPRTTLRYAIERFTPAERERMLTAQFD
ncbi:MAG TPA: DNA alkylation repair protein [Bryobacteraceae bacterium]|nr:DNA alkylation repair protein [Bryobacteraceae bacterium]